MFTAYMLGAHGLLSASSLRTLSSKCVSASSSGKLMAALSVLENLGKVLGPLLHTAIYVASLPVHPALVYYVMAAQAALLLLFVPAVYMALQS